MLKRVQGITKLITQKNRVPIHFLADFLVQKICTYYYYRNQVVCKMSQGNSARLYEPKILMNAALFLIDSTASLMILSSIWPSKST